MEEVAIRELKNLLEAEVLENTYASMIKLKNALHMIEQASGELKDLLLKLSSESIREALHKHELSITNAIITRKNVIFKNSGISVPDGHEPIDRENYKNYNW